MEDVYENTTSSITTINQQFHDFAAAINEVCNQASLFGRSLQSLEDLTIPEIIGSGQVNFKPKKLSTHKFTSSEHLSDSFVTFAKWVSNA